MAKRPPIPFKQTKADNCALACLRSILFFFGTEIGEDRLEALANKQDWGVEIGDLAQAAQEFGLAVHTRSLEAEDLVHLLANGVFPIVYLNRIHFGRKGTIRKHFAPRNFIPHAVVPLRITSKFVIYNDLLTGYDEEQL